MNDELNKAETIDFNSARLASVSNRVKSRITEPEDAYTKLARKLQTSLDADTLVRYFIDELQDYLTIDQYHFSFLDTSPLADFGNLKHQCDYHLKLEGEYLGRLILASARKFSPEALTLIEYLLAALVFPLRNAKAYHVALEAAMTDPLTGVSNKRAYHQEINREIEMAKRYGRGISIMVLDIDRFKQINDKHGHAIGDQVLVGVAEAISEASRKCDSLFRYGGEEFVVLLRETDEDGLKAITERARQAVENRRHFVDGTSLAVTVSIGAAVLEADEGAAGLFDRADAELYRAKKQGRNRVCLWQPEANTETLSA